MAKQNNELLLKNHQSRPTGFMPLSKANATSIQTLGHGQGQGRGYGRGWGRGCGHGRGHGKHNSSHRSGSQSKKNNSNY